MPQQYTQREGSGVPNPTRRARTIALVGASLLTAHTAFLAGCATRASASPAGPTAATPVETRPNYADQLISLVESYQPADPYLPNRWSQAVRTAFLYSGGLKVFAADSQPVLAYLGGDTDRRRVEDFMLAPLGELPFDAPAGPGLTQEARRFLGALDSQELLLHLDQIAAPCRLAAPPPYRGVSSPLSAQETYEQGALKNLAVACCVRMQFAADDANPQPLVLSFRSGMQLGRALCGRPMLLSLMNAQSTQNRVMMQAVRSVRSGRVDADACRNLLTAVEETRLPHPVIFLEMERIIGHDAIDRYFRQKAQEQAAAAEGVASTTELSRSEALVVFDAAMDRGVEILREEIGETPLKPEARTTSGATLSTLEIPPGRTDPDGLLASLMPPLSSFIMAELEYRCTRAALTTVLLLELHRLEHGTYPDSLSILGSPPPDPLAPDRPLAYIPPTSTTSYALYSVGSDRTDNGGKPAPSPRPRRDALFVPPRWVGTDFLIIQAAAH